MRLGYAKRGRRVGFTLIELLVVIAIMSVLATLLLAAVMKGIGKAQDVRTQSEIQQLDAKIGLYSNFSKTVDYFPSRILLCEYYGDYASFTTASTTPPDPANAQLARDSLAFLSALFPKILNPGPGITAPAAGVAGNAAYSVWANSGIDWDGNGTTTRGTHWILEGHQCLVFFLGGIPNAPPQAETRGFSSSPFNPADFSGTYHINAPHFRFNSVQLVRLAGSPFFSYLDGFRNTRAPVPCVYAYFSNYHNHDGYNRYYNTVTKFSDCPSLGPLDVLGRPLGVWPYAVSAGRYHKPDTYQIISAGQDGAWGPGTNPTLTPIPYWSEGPTAFNYGNTFPRGRDDLSNFARRQLGY